MNLLELDALIKSCEQQSEMDLVAYYKGRRTMLVKQIARNVSKALQYL